MLVLSRKHQQQICIGDNIKITVLQVKGKTVRIGIEAPPNIRILRAELPRHPNCAANFDESSESTTEEAEPTESSEVVHEILHAGSTDRRPLSIHVRGELNAI